MSIYCTTNSRRCGAPIPRKLLTQLYLQRAIFIWLQYRYGGGARGSRVSADSLCYVSLLAKMSTCAYLHNHDVTGRVEDAPSAGPGRRSILEVSMRRIVMLVGELSLRYLDGWRNVHASSSTCYYDQIHGPPCPLECYKVFQSKGTARRQTRGVAESPALASLEHILRYMNALRRPQIESTQNSGKESTKPRQGGRAIDALDLRAGGPTGAASRARTNNGQTNPQSWRIGGLEEKTLFSKSRLPHDCSVLACPSTSTPISSVWTNSCPYS